MPLTLTLSFSPAIPAGQSASTGASVTFTLSSVDTSYLAIRRDTTFEDKDATLKGRQVRLLPYISSKPAPQQEDKIDGVSIQQVQAVSGDDLSDWASDLIQEHATHAVTLRRSNNLKPSSVVLAAGVAAGATSLQIKAPTGDISGRVVSGSTFTIAGITGTYTVSTDTPAVPPVQGVAFYRCHLT